MKYSRIIGTGGYLPQRVMTNAELEKMVDTTDEWIVERTGIRERHIAAADEGTCDLALQAAAAAIEAAGIKPAAVDLVIVATTTPDQVFPSTACLLQQRLGIHGPAAFDIQAVCTGFIYALAVADKFIKTESAATVLVVGADTMSRITDWNDRGTCVLFGDGAGAVIVKADNRPGIIATRLNADGRYHELLEVPAGVSRGYDTLKAGEAYMRMQGNEVFRIAVNTLGQIAEGILAANHMDKAELDWLVPHQANIRILTATAKKLNMPMEKVIVTIGEHGNTSAASVPLSLDVAVRSGRIKAGDSILMEAFGGGFTWGTALLRY